MEASMYSTKNNEEKLCITLGKRKETVEVAICPKIPTYQAAPIPGKQNVRDNITFSDLLLYLDILPPLSHFYLQRKGKRQQR